jgi:hypothetical protein
MQLDAAWAARWPGLAPMPGGEYFPRRDLYGVHWVRFHSLPNGKRYAETPDETREILERHFAVLEALHTERTSDLLIVGEDWGWYDGVDLAGGWTKRYLPGAWPWRKWRHDSDEESDPFHYFWVSSARQVRDLGPLLERVAAWQATVWISDNGLNWMYHPYDGGADVYARTADERDSLVSSYSTWLPEAGDM